MDLQSLGNYYVWAEEQIQKAISELSDTQFTERHDGLGRSVRQLAEHLYVTYESLAHPPTPETWTMLNEKVQAMNRGQFITNWTSATKKFAESMLADDRNKITLPVGEDKSLTLEKDNFYLLYTDHQTYHRAQMNSLLKIMGKKGVNTDYFSFAMGQ